MLTLPWMFAFQTHGAVRSAGGSLSSVTAMLTAVSGRRQGGRVVRLTV
jgi:hypothetical protein